MHNDKNSFSYYIRMLMIYPLDTFETTFVRLSNMYDEIYTSMTLDDIRLNKKNYTRDA